MATLFEAYVTNAGKYSEGQLVGETLKFPTTAQEVEALLKRIGVDGVRYQEIFITSFDGDVLGLYIPKEHKVFSFPKLSIREQMAAYQEIIDGSSLEGYRQMQKKDRGDR